MWKQRVRVWKSKPFRMRRVVWDGFLETSMMTLNLLTAASLFNHNVNQVVILHFKLNDVDGYQRRWYNVYKLRTQEEVIKRGRKEIISAHNTIIAHTESGVSPSASASPSNKKRTWSIWIPCRLQYAFFNCKREQLKEKKEMEGEKGWKEKREECSACTTSLRTATC